MKVSIINSVMKLMSQFHFCFCDNIKVIKIYQARKDNETHYVLFQSLK